MSSLTGNVSPFGGWLVSITNILIKGDRGQPQREQHSKLNWKCLSIVRLASDYYQHLNKQRQRPAAEGAAFPVELGMLLLGVFGVCLLLMY